VQVTHEGHTYQLRNEHLEVEDLDSGDWVLIPLDFLHDFMASALQYEAVEKEVSMSRMLGGRRYDHEVVVREGREFILGPNKTTEAMDEDIQATSGRGASCDPEDKRDVKREWTSDELRDSEDPDRIRWTKSGTTKRDPYDPVG